MTDTFMRKKYPKSDTFVRDHWGQKAIFTSVQPLLQTCCQQQSNLSGCGSHGPHASFGNEHVRNEPVVHSIPLQVVGASSRTKHDQTEGCWEDLWAPTQHNQFWEFLVDGITQPWWATIFSLVSWPKEELHIEQLGSSHGTVPSTFRVYVPCSVKPSRTPSWSHPKACFLGDCKSC
jgi:hypothetical protein